MIKCTNGKAILEFHDMNAAEAVLQFGWVIIGEPDDNGTAAVVGDVEEEAEEEEPVQEPEEEPVQESPTPSEKPKRRATPVRRTPTRKKK